MGGEKLNITYVCREFGPVTGGGIGTYIYHACLAMHERGHRIFLITDCFTGKDMELLPDGVELICPVETRANRCGDFFSPHHEYSFRVYDTLQELASRVKVDVAEFAEFGVEGFAAIRAKRLFGEFPDTKLIVKLHTPSSLLYHINEDRRLHLDSLCDYYMEDYCVRHADLVTSPSRSLGQYFEKRVGRKDIRQCPYPMDVPDSDITRSFTEKQIFTVRLIGSIQVRKGIDTFIKAAAEVLQKESRFRFEIWGADRSPRIFGRSYQDICRRLIPDEFRDKIVFCGAVPYSDIPSLFLDSCFCVYPSRWENWANVCLEAMSFGCVVAVSREGGMAEMVEHGRSGFIVDPLDPCDIAATILANYQDVERLVEISRQARTRSVEICDPDKAAERMEENYLAQQVPRNRQELSATVPLVSVVIPYFNQPEYVGEAIASVQRSDYPNLEIVVVNDGSTTEAANTAFQSLVGVVKVEKENGGLSSARNAGIRVAQGTFVLPLDADDVIAPSYISKAVLALFNNPELGYVSCHAQNFGELTSAYIPIGFVPELMPYFNTHGKCCNLYRKELFSGTTCYDEVMTSYEDWDLLLCLDGQGIVGDVLPEELFRYRRHFDSMVYSTANRQRADLVQYMMIKHETALAPYAGQMAIMLARLWKETEMKHELAEQQIANLVTRPNHFGELQRGNRARCQVYSKQGNGYWEHNSVYLDYNAGAWTNLTVNLPFAGQDGVYRLDPCNASGLVIIKEISLIDKRTERPIVRFNGRQSFARCVVEGTATAQVRDDFLVIDVTGPDPQIHLPAVSPHLPVMLSVILYCGDDAERQQVDTVCARYRQRQQSTAGFVSRCKRLYRRFLG